MRSSTNFGEPGVGLTGICVFDFEMYTPAVVAVLLMLSVLKLRSVQPAVPLRSPLTTFRHKYARQSERAIRPV